MYTGVFAAIDQPDSGPTCLNGHLQEAASPSSRACALLQVPVEGCRPVVGLINGRKGSNVPVIPPMAIEVRGEYMKFIRSEGRTPEIHKK